MNPSLSAVLAALLFGVALPLSKELLGETEPLPLAGLLYLGSGLVLIIPKIFRKNEKEAAPLCKEDIKWLLGSIISGGILAPIILMIGLKNTSAAAGSLLVNFEIVATALLAAFFFKEKISVRVWLAVISITVAGMALSVDFSSGLKFSGGALAIIAACFFWALDNNFTRKISAKDPFTIVIIKGLGAGIFSTLLAIYLGNPFPSQTIIIYALLLGGISYGLSLLFFVRALHGLGAARTSALFGTAPFIGALLSLFISQTTLNAQFFIAFALMALGAWLILKED